MWSLGNTEERGKPCGSHVEEPSRNWNCKYKGITRELEITATEWVAACKNNCLENKTNAEISKHHWEDVSLPFTVALNLAEQGCAQGFVGIALRLALFLSCLLPTEKWNFRAWRNKVNGVSLCSVLTEQLRHRTSLICAVGASPWTPLVKCNSLCPSFLWLVTRYHLGAPSVSHSSVGQKSEVSPF